MVTSKESRSLRSWSALFLWSASACALSTGCEAFGLSHDWHVGDSKHPSTGGQPSHDVGHEHNPPDAEPCPEPEPSIQIRALVNPDAVVPGGQDSRFAGFGFDVFSPRDPGRDLSVFMAFGTGGELGAYAAHGAGLSRLVDLTSVIPGTQETFVNFGDVTLARRTTGHPVSPQDPTFAAFTGQGFTAWGVYSQVLYPPTPVAPNDPYQPQDPFRIVDTTTPVPGGLGSSFTSFRNANLVSWPPDPVVPSDPIRLLFSFIGDIGGGIQGGIFAQPTDPLYPPDPIVPQAPRALASFSTPIPNGTGNFTSFSGLAMSPLPTTALLGPAAELVFVGNGSDLQTGFYRTTFRLDGTSDGPTPITALVDRTTVLPDSPNGGLFDSSAWFSLSPEGLAFNANSGFINGGVYLIPTDAGQPGDPFRIADFSTTIPGTSETFGGFNTVSTAQGQVAFVAQGMSLGRALYLAHPSIERILGVGDTWSGQSVLDVRLGSEGLQVVDGTSYLIFSVLLADNTEQLLIAEISE
jgi:hypothetical protein